MRMDTMSGYSSPRGVFPRKKFQPPMSLNNRHLRRNLPQKLVTMLVVTILPLLVGKADPKGLKGKANKGPRQNA